MNNEKINPDWFKKVNSNRNENKKFKTEKIEFPKLKFNNNMIYLLLF